MAKPDDKTIPVGGENPAPSGQRPAIKTNPQGVSANPPSHSKSSGVGVPSNPSLKTPTTGRHPALVRLGDEPNAPSYSNRDLFAGSRTDVKPINPGQAAAAEVSQGAWRERAFTPRGVMSAEEIVKGMTETLGAVRTKQGPKTLMLAKVRDEWLQLLRQAVEQAGGDCLDTWLTAALKPGSGRAGINLVLVELYVAFEKMRAALSTEVMLEVAETCITAVKETLDAPSKRPCSFKVLERELEGKIDVDGLILLLLSSEDELTQRAKEIGSTLERLRDELKNMPGARPDGMYSNFARLKAEARVIDGELKRRARASTPG